MLSREIQDQIKKEGVSLEIFIDTLYEANGTGSGATDCLEIAQYYGDVWKNKAVGYEKTLREIKILSGDWNSKTHNEITKLATKVLKQFK